MLSGDLVHPCTAGEHCPDGAHDDMAMIEAMNTRPAAREAVKASFVDAIAWIVNLQKLPLASRNR